MNPLAVTSLLTALAVAPAQDDGTSLRLDDDGGESARVAEAPRRKPASPGKRTAVDARKVGRSCRRIQASVMTPRMPSDPMKRRSGLGPAPEPGSRRDSITPPGVTTRSASTKSSMCV